jgi:hypothetical protein
VVQLAVAALSERRPAVKDGRYSQSEDDDEKVWL